MKIGIPQSLLYMYYYPFWKTYFEEIGMEVVNTPVTTKEIIDKGIKASVPEICVPIKVYIGHVLTLIEKQVDYVFVPRFVSIQKGQFFCPKFMGLPDMIRHSFRQIEDKLIIQTIETDDESISNIKNYKIFEEKFGISSQKNKQAILKAQKTWMNFRYYCKKGYLAPDAQNVVLNNTIEKPVRKIEKEDTPITLGVLGYVYNIYDPFISMDITERLKEMGVIVKTFEMLEDEELNKQLKNLSKTLFWTFSDKLLAAGYSYYQNSEVDGLIHVTAFGCGPDSMLGKLLEYDSSKYKKPFMTVRIDEHSGENHLQTRIEAFVDMIKRKKQKTRRGA